MSAEPTNAADSGEGPTIHVPRMCKYHESDTVRRLQLGPDDAWMLAIVNMNILLFQRACRSRRINARAPAAEDLSLVLNELGCLACWDRPGFRAAIALNRRGLSHAAQVAQGKATDPDWPEGPLP